MPSEIVSCRFKVEGVRTDRDVKKALQSLYDIFADHGLGQAAFDITGDAHADLIIKHLASVNPDHHRRRPGPRGRLPCDLR